MDIPPTLSELRDQRTQLTFDLQGNPYSFLLFLERGRVYERLGYPDLAITDIYKALLLADEVLEDSGEFHDEAISSAVNILADGHCRHRLRATLGLNHGPHNLPQRTSTNETLNAQELDWESSTCQDIVQNFVIPYASVFLAHCLASIGCLRTAYEYVQNSLRFTRNNVSAEKERKFIVQLAKSCQEHSDDPFDENRLDIENWPDQGFVRREVYDWNNHEQDRMTQNALKFLNTEMSVVAPKLEVKLTDLPVLTESTKAEQSSTSRQLGVFANADIKPGEHILLERSLLTANARLHEPFCDACSAVLPEVTTFMDTESGHVHPVSCSECDDAVFCSQKCLDLAQASYHPSVCGADVDSIAKEVPAKQAVDALYTQLLFRSLAMAHTQDQHPLDLKEVKYIWGDFVNAHHREGAGLLTEGEHHFHNHIKTLPYSFDSQVLQPFHFLELLDINIFEAPYELAETWVYNTLLAKFRGTASARISPRDGRPEVAAVHPLWCLANHSCDPNVEWEWAGEITLRARSMRTQWTRRSETGPMTFCIPGEEGGIAAGEEILNHYVDVDLDVKERREWGAGALGGYCRCCRCLWEAGENDLENLKP